MFVPNTFFQRPKQRLYTWTSPGRQYRNQIHYVLWNQRWRSCIQISKTRLDADCGSDHEVLLEKIGIKLKKTGKVIGPSRYDLSNVPHKYTVKVKNGFEGLELVGRMPEELWTEIKDTIKDETIKNISKSKKQKQAKCLSSEALKVAEERRKAKGQRKLDKILQTQYRIPENGKMRQGEIHEGTMQRN